MSGIRATEVSVDGSELLQAILDSPTQHAIIVTDVDGLIRIWNKGAARIFQYSDGEIVGTDARVLFSPDDLAHDIPDKEMAAASREVASPLCFSAVASRRILT